MGKSNLRSGSSPKAVLHSDISSDSHKKDAFFLAKKSKKIMVLSDYISAFPVQKGDLFSTRLLKGYDVHADKLENSSDSADCIAALQKEILSLPVYKNTYEYKDGEKKPIRRKVKIKDKDIFVRDTFSLSPELSIMWKHLDDSKRKILLPYIYKVIAGKASVRWPDADISKIIMHDDTSYLHFDVWGKKGSIKEEEVGRWKKMTKFFNYVPKSMNINGIGAGACFSLRKYKLDESCVHVSEKDTAKAALEFTDKRSDVEYMSSLDIDIRGLFKGVDEKLYASCLSSYLDSIHKDNDSKFSLYDGLKDLPRKVKILKGKEKDLLQKEKDLLQKEKGLDSKLLNFITKEKELEEKAKELLLLKDKLKDMNESIEEKEKRALVLGLKDKILKAELDKLEEDLNKRKIALMNKQIGVASIGLSKTLLNNSDVTKVLHKNKELKEEVIEYLLSSGHDKMIRHAAYLKEKRY